jgi:hypothetical protein
MVATLCSKASRTTTSAGVGMSRRRTVGDDTDVVTYGGWPGDEQGPWITVDALHVTARSAVLV